MFGPICTICTANTVNGTFTAVLSISDLSAAMNAIQRPGVCAHAEKAKRRHDTPVEQPASKDTPTAHSQLFTLDSNF